MAISRFTEKRSYPRMKVPAGLSFRVPGIDSTYLRVCRDLSHTGICFHTSKFLENGSAIEVMIDTGHSSFAPFRAQVEIVRSGKDAESNLAVAGRIMHIE